ncbi:MAG: ABC transporter substrate-binding protein [Myxococcota bacterium]
MTRALLLALLASFSLAAPTRAEIVEARRGHWHRPPEESLALPTSPQRIVSLAPVLTETLFALGVGARVVGVTRFCDRPAAATTLPRVGGFIDPQLEAILALKPDLVVAMPSLGQRSLLDRLREQGIPIAVLFGDTLAEVRDMIAFLGVAVGEPERAAALRATLDAGLARIRDEARLRDIVPRVVVAVQSQPLVVAGPGTFADEAIIAAGGVPAVSREAPAWPSWSLEALLASRPDVIISAEGEAGAAALRARFGVLARGGQPLVVAAAKGPILMRPGPTLHEDVAVLSRLIEGATRPLPRGPP